MLRTLVSPWTGCTMAERKKSAWGPFFLTPLVGSGGVCQAVSAVFDVGLSERLRPLWKQLSAAQSRLRYHAIFAWEQPNAASSKTL